MSALKERQADEPGRRVLMLTHRVPYPPDRGDRIRAYHLLEAISRRYKVTLAAIADEPVTDATRARLDTLCQRVLLAKAKPMRRRTAAAKALLTGQAITPAAMHDAALAKQLTHLHAAEPFDTILTYCTGMIGYAGLLLQGCHDRSASAVGRANHRHATTRTADRQAGSTVAPLKPPRHVLDLVDVDSLKWTRFAEQSRGPMRRVYQAEAHRLRAVEAGEVVPFDVVTIISDAEAVRYREHVTDRYQPVVVNNGVDLDRFYPRGDANTPTLIFTGVMSYKPNIDAVVWFARKVMLRVLAAVPEARFEIVGKSPAREVAALDELPGVRVVGPVDDTAESLRRAAVAVAPMFIAPGVQNKVLEAMACGLPVVCSTQAASGIDASPGEHLLVHDSEADVAAQCVRLLLNQDERQRLGTAARQRVEQRYDWPSAVAPMMKQLASTEHEASASDPNPSCEGVL